MSFAFLFGLIWKVIFTFLLSLIWNYDLCNSACCIVFPCHSITGFIGLPFLLALCTCNPSFCHIRFFFPGHRYVRPNHLRGYSIISFTFFCIIILFFVFWFCWHFWANWENTCTSLIKSESNSLITHGHLFSHSHEKMSLLFSPQLSCNSGDWGHVHVWVQVFHVKQMSLLYSA